MQLHKAAEVIKRNGEVVCGIEQLFTRQSLGKFLAVTWGLSGWGGGDL